MRRIWIIAISVPLFLLFLFVSLYAFDQVSHRDRVARNVYAGGVPLGNLSEEAATEAVAAYEANLVTTPAGFVLGEQTVVLDPAEISLSVDETSVVETAMQRGRTESILSDFTAWLKSHRERIDIVIPVTVDDDAIAVVLTRWDTTELDDPAFDGAVVLEGGVAVAQHPVAGTRIYHEASVPIVHATVASPERAPAPLPLIDIVPTLTTSTVDRAVEQANQLIGSKVSLLLEGRTEQTLRVHTTELATAMRSEVVENSRPSLEVWLDDASLVRSVQFRLPQFDTDPVDASFEFVEPEGDEDGTVIIHPSSPGVGVDRDLLPERIVQAAVGNGIGEVPLMIRAEPELTTEMAEAMGPFTKVSEFTTYHPCCQRRNTNINNLADEIDGALVMPGETFSVNDHAGKRTVEEGYVRAGAIINGVVSCCDSPINIGGGTSQFATTFYNAVFFGCYEDVEHQPHSLYFSRYPLGREATLGFPKPDVIFRNDTGTPVIIDTWHTGGSITVAFYGNTEGRECTAESSGRSTVRTVRVITYPDGRVVREPFTWTYRPKQ
jgi:vancomycin resistance protein YoaR